MNKFPEQFKFVIYCIGLGVGLIVYAHANFSTVKQADKLELKISSLATSNDVSRVENKVDKILFHLIGKK
jgi:p-aminobenzoyl-glutamate transporter AbgT